MAGDEEDTLEHRYQIDGYKLAIGVFLNAPLRRSEFRARFQELEDEARRQNMHAATIEVLRSVREQLSDDPP
jgi:hypothetical protein